MLRRRWTPAPSTTGSGVITCATGRDDSLIVGYLLQLEMQVRALAIPGCTAALWPRAAVREAESRASSGRGSPGHRFPQRALALIEVGLGLPDQHLGPVTQLLALLHQVARRVPDLVRPAPHLIRQHRAAVEMAAHALGEIAAAAGAEVRAAAERIRGELDQAEADVAAHAVGHGVTEAVHEEQRTLFRGQGLRSLAVDVRQVAAQRLHDVGADHRPRALRALHLHVAPPSHPTRRRFGRWCSTRSTPAWRAKPDPIGRDAPCATRALNGEAFAERTTAGTSAPDVSG